MIHVLGKTALGCAGQIIAGVTNVAPAWQEHVLYNTSRRYYASSFRVNVTVRFCSSFGLLFSLEWLTLHFMLGDFQAGAYLRGVIDTEPGRDSLCTRATCRVQPFFSRASDTVMRITRTILWKSAVVIVKCLISVCVSSVWFILHEVPLWKDINQIQDSFPRCETLLKKSFREV